MYRVVTQLAQPPPLKGYSGQLLHAPHDGSWAYPLVFPSNLDDAPTSLIHHAGWFMGHSHRTGSMRRVMHAHRRTGHGRTGSIPSRVFLEPRRCTNVVGPPRMMGHGRTGSIQARGRRCYFTPLRVSCDAMVVDRGPHPTAHSPAHSLSSTRTAGWFMGVRAARGM